MLVFFSIYCIVVSLLLFSPSIDKPRIVNMSLAPPRLVHKLFEGGKVM